MPWPGFFYKMALCDHYVVFDHVQFKRRYFENRNLIVSPSGESSYIGVPVQSKGRFNQPISEVKIDRSQRWKEKILRKIEHYYKKAAFFDAYFPELRRIIQEKEYVFLKDVNLAFISFFREHLDIKTPFSFSSSLKVEDRKGSDLVLQICLAHKADIYLSGKSGEDYLKLDDFSKSGISVKMLDYRPPVYRQLCAKHVPGVSTLDLLFNHGKESKKILIGTS